MQNLEFFLRFFIIQASVWWQLQLPAYWSIEWAGGHSAGEIGLPVGTSQVRWGGERRLG